MDNKNKKPTIFTILKIIGFSLLGLGIILLIIGLCTHVPEMSDDNWFEQSGKRSLLIFGGISCMMISSGLIISGFKTEIAKLHTKTTKYIQEENKEDLTTIASNTADIASDAITTTTKAIKEGLKDTKFCKHCGKEIDKDSKFCSNCGKEQ